MEIIEEEEEKGEKGRKKSVKSRSYSETEKKIAG